MLFGARSGPKILGKIGPLEGDFPGYYHYFCQEQGLLLLLLFLHENGDVSVIRRRNKTQGKIIFIRIPHGIMHC